MNIDLLASSFSYKELFELQPKIFNAYESFLKVKNKLYLKQKPFKVLIHKYNKIENNLIFFKEGDFITDLIFKNMTLDQINELEKNFSGNIFDKFDEEKHTYEMDDEIFMFAETIFFCGLKLYLKNIWNVYYNEENNMIINVINKKNDEFLKLFVQTNDNIYSEKYYIKNGIQKKIEFKKDGEIFNSEYFCI